MRVLTAVLLCVAMMFAVSCGKTVARVDTDQAIDLSGRWNDTDSQLVSDEMIKDALARPWLKRFTQGHASKPPVVIVGTVKNKSNEHINVSTFVKDMERALINSGEVEFVASASQRQEIRDEKTDQAMYAKEETAKMHGQEEGADFMLQGTISAIQDKEGGKSVMFYQIDLELLDISSHKMVWSGQKKIKKFIERSGWSL